MIKGSYIAYFYLTILCLYQLYDILYSDGIFSYFVLIALLGVSVYYAIWTNVQEKIPIYIVALNVLLGMFTIYGIGLILFDYNTVGFSDIDKKSFLKYIYISLLPIYAFYGLTKKGHISKDTIQLWIPVIILVAFYSFLHYENKMLEELGKTAEEGLTNNQAYLFLSVIPSLFFIKRSIYKYFFLAVCVVFIVISMKRGAMLIGSICLLWFVLFSIGQVKNTYRIWGVLIVVIIGVISYNFLYSELSDNAYFMMRYNDTIDGRSSGRDDIYSTAINVFFNDYDAFSFLFGRGAYASLQVLGKFAHNDWVEVLVCQGFLGIMVYLWYWIILIKTSLKKSQEKTLLTAFRMSVLIMFMTSLYSMSYSSTPFPLSMVVGYYMAHECDIIVCNEVTTDCGDESNYP